MAGVMNALTIASTGKPDLDFVQGMIPHHQGAIDMAKVGLQFGKDPEIRSLAESVIEAQEAKIAFMRDWLANTDRSSLVTIAVSKKLNEEVMSVMMRKMMVPYAGDADFDFVKGMVPHHQGAIDMAKIGLQFAKGLCAVEARAGDCDRTGR
jgi:uncharacterized protein (DUF305 family)